MPSTDAVVRTIHVPREAKNEIYNALLEARHNIKMHGSDRGDVIEIEVNPNPENWDGRAARLVLKFEQIPIVPPGVSPESASLKIAMSSDVLKPLIDAGLVPKLCSRAIFDCQALQPVRCYYETFGAAGATDITLDLGRGGFVLHPSPGLAKSALALATELKSHLSVLLADAAMTADELDQARELLKRPDVAALGAS